MATKREMRVALLEQALTRKGQLHLKEAARLLQVSEMTVRRDIGANKHAFVYLGGHIFLPPTVSGYKLSTEDRGLTEAKAKAARHAAGLIKSNTTIFIDSGTTLLHLATSIPRELELTVVTSSQSPSSCRRSDEYPACSRDFTTLPRLLHHRRRWVIAPGNQAFRRQAASIRSAGAKLLPVPRRPQRPYWRRPHTAISSLRPKIGVLRPVLFAPRAFDRVLTERRCAIAGDPLIAGERRRRRR